MRQLATRLAFVLRILCAAALFTGGLSGAPQASERSLSIGEIAYYLLPDGTLPELCITLPDGNGTGKIVKISPDTANSVNAFALPERITLGEPHAHTNLRALVVAVNTTIVALQRSPVSGPRAPPIS